MGRSLFGVPGLLEASDFKGLMAKCMRGCGEIEGKIRGARSREQLRLIVPWLDQLSNNLCSVLDMAECLSRLHCREDFRRHARRCADDLHPYLEHLNTDRGLYQALLASLDFDSHEHFMDRETRLVGESFRRDFEHGGIHLSCTQRARFRRLQDRIHQIGLSYEGLMKQRRSHRECLGLISDLAHDRHQLALLLGFPSYAHLFLSDKNLQSPEQVEDFLSQMHNEHPTNTPIPISNANLSIHQVLNHLMYILQTTFNLKCTRQAPSVHSWATNLLSWTFVDHQSGHDYGEVLLEYGNNNSTSPLKPLTACHFTIKTWKTDGAANFIYETANVQTPTVVISLNIADTSRLTIDEIRSIFHEFGHAIHTICSKTKYHHLSGTRCALDLAEIPSTLFELFLTDPRHQLVFDDQTNRATLQNQILLSRFDQLIHDYQRLLAYGGGNGFSLEEAIRSWLGQVQPQLSPQAFLQQLTGFAHLFGYGAGYYSYLFGRRVAERIWSGLFHQQTLNPPAGMLFRQGALLLGGLANGREIVTALGIDPL